MPNELPELNQILQSGALAYGKWGKLFESKLSDFIGNNKVLVVNSYNSAVLVALTTMDIKHGDEVIASPMSCLASNQPIITQGAKIVWADIDPLLGTLDPDSVKSKISSKTKAIFHNHHCGYLGYINEINTIAKEFGLFVVDDAIEAFGSQYDNKRIGNLDTDITLFSFQTVRLPNSIDGGGLSFNNEDLYIKAQRVRDLGVDRSTFRDVNGEISINSDISLPGFGATLNEINSYVGCKQMDDIDHLLKIQADNALKWGKRINDEFPEINILRTITDSIPNYWIYGMLVSDKKKYIDIFRDQSFYASGVHLNNNEYTVFNNQTFLPGVKDFYNKFIAVPSGWWVDLK